MKILRRTTVAVVGLLMCVTASFAEDCQAYLRSMLDREPALSSIYVTMATLNSSNVVSYAETRLYYVVGKRIPNGPFLPGKFTRLDPGSAGIDQPKFDFGKSVQVFSDRLTSDRTLIGQFVGLSHHGRQKFDERRADDLSLDLTDTPPVRATITLRSWNNAKSTFTPVCEAGGFMYGSTPDVKYLLRVVKWPPPAVTHE